ncbi:ribbon-helix-helix protein, CopG family [Rothia nasimurium]|uniref:Ribbon-helix-helix protein, CopG family n=1 Tax=Rothia nasimurium TaxID=85336 RepID=A0A4Y9F309_9MICC|nr:ribbon-helix-helix protein, CopG family [Rothia nasimurium]MBF0808901.1 ribbon-helix-helix protein, CopG family [Rothia nasimurium]TFU21086.1 ribbon-helix-helix protein, CopG family [Rothia nasimurium]
MPNEPHNLTMEELEALGEKLSVWAESDEFFEALETATITPRNADTIARAEKIVAAATRGRPALAETVNGHSPSINARVTPDIKDRLTRYTQEQGVSTSEVIREALDKFLPQAA